MKNAQQRIPYAKDLTQKNSLTKEYLDHLAHLERQDLEASRAKTRTSRPNVQMSIRMPEDEYFRFRALCIALRKTNGEMVAHLMEAFLREGRGAESPVLEVSSQRT
jgi:hypothetical protein